MTVNACVELLKQRLGKHRISLDNLVYIVTNGASVMLSDEMLVIPKHELCIVHVIHLAISEIPYKTLQQNSRNH